MKEPKTLLHMVGADMTPCALGDSALILIDCQMEYVDGPLALPDVKSALKECSEVLARAREAGAPVFHIVHKGKAGGAFDLDAPRGQIAPEVSPIEGEQTVEKSLPNAFAGTNLDDLIKQTGKSELIVVGFMTHMCVSSTVRAALDLGYRSTIVESAAATRDLPLPTGGVINAKDLHNSSLAALSDRFAVIALTAGDLPG